MTWLCVALGTALFLTAVIGTAAAQEKKQAESDSLAQAKLEIVPLLYGAMPVRPQVVSFQSNSWDLYPRREEVSIRSFQQTADPPGVLLSLRSDVEGFSHYMYTQRRDSLEAGEARESRDGEIAVRFERRNEARSQVITTEIQAVSRSGEKMRPYRIVIGYYPKELYAAGGQTSPSWLVVQNTDLALSQSGVEDWIIDAPTAEDRAYAERRWGELVRGYPTDYEKAQALARAVATALRPCGGVPSDRMLTAPPFEQLEMALKGEGGVACENHSAIFSWACNALDIPARRISMNYPWSSSGDTNLEIAEGHHTTEVFDRGLNRWVWIDVTFNALGVYLGDQGPLHLAELVQNLNDGGRVGALTVVAFDPGSGKEQRVPVLECRQREALFKYFKKDQQFRYVRRP